MDAAPVEPQWVRQRAIVLAYDVGKMATGFSERSCSIKVMRP
jgi:hypothetical protein